MLRALSRSCGTGSSSSPIPAPTRSSASSHRPSAGDARLGRAVREPPRRCAHSRRADPRYRWERLPTGPLRRRFPGRSGHREDDDRLGSAVHRPVRDHRRPRRTDPRRRPERLPPDNFGAVLGVDPATGARTTIASGSPFMAPKGIALAPRWSDARRRRGLPRRPGDRRAGQDRIGHTALGLRGHRGRARRPDPRRRPGRLPPEPGRDLRNNPLRGL